jgi:hypothetical protein
MIFTPIINILYWVIYGLLYPISLLDNATLPVALTGAFTIAGQYLSNLDKIFPIATIFLTLGSVIAVESGIAIWKGIQWLIKKIPTIN